MCGVFIRFRWHSTPHVQSTGGNHSLWHFGTVSATVFSVLLFALLQIVTVSFCGGVSSFNIDILFKCGSAAGCILYYTVEMSRWWIRKPRATNYVKIDMVQKPYGTTYLAAILNANRKLYTLHNIQTHAAHSLVWLYWMVLLLVLVLCLLLLESALCLIDVLHYCCVTLKTEWMSERATVCVRKANRTKSYRIV